MFLHIFNNQIYPFEDKAITLEVMKECFIYVNKGIKNAVFDLHYYLLDCIWVLM